MSAKGFSKKDAATEVERIIKRLKPSVQREDADAYDRALVELAHSGTDKDAISEAITALAVNSEWLLKHCCELIPKEAKPLIAQEAIAIIAEVLTSAGFRLEDNMRVIDEGVALTHDAVKALTASGYPGIAQFSKGNESLEGIGFSRDEFCHPLADAMEAEGEEWINNWALASMVIVGANGWAEADKQKCKQILTEVVSRVSPTTDINLMLHRARYDDRVLLRLCSLFVEGVEQQNPV